MRSKSNIKAGNTIYEFSYDNGICIDASAGIDWAIGLPVVHIVAYCKRNGWLVIPVIDEPRNVFVYRGSTYELQWQDGRLVSLTKDGEQIALHEFPEKLKGLL